MARSPGSLPLGDELIEALQLCEAVLRTEVVPDSALQEAAAQFDALLRADLVDDAESELGVSLPGELLALIAVSHPIAGLVTGIVGLEAVLDATAEPAVEGWLPVSKVYHEPIIEAVQGAPGGPYRTLYVRPGFTLDVPIPLLVLEEGVPDAETTLGAYISETLRHDYELLDDLPPLGPAGDYEVPSPELCTAEDLAPPSAARVRRVHHRKFGDGTVTATEGDKLTITFDDGTTKVLKESFVSDL
jgi:hypothetical protein